MEIEIKKIAKYLKVPVGKISYTTDDNIIQMKTTGEDKAVGFSTILNHFHSVVAEHKTSEDYFLTKQFFDYSNLFIRSNSTSKRDKVTACSELNSYLETKSYFVGQNISIADLVVFYTIAETMKNLSPQDKAQFVNLCRWYEHLQLQDSVRQGTGVVNFSSVHLPVALRG